MEKLEKKIIKKVYILETKKTVFEVILRTLVIIGSAFIGLIFGQLLFDQLYEQQTLDVLQLFNEDIQIIREYFGDVSMILFDETPKDLLFLFFVSFLLFFTAVLTLIKNFEKIKRKFKSLSHFWFGR